MRHERPDGTPCGDRNESECDAPDSCQDGACDAQYASSGTTCGVHGIECRLDDTCDGAGTCQFHGYAEPGTECGDDSDSACDAPDTCNASGTCLPNHEPDTTACGTPAATCRFADHCDGNGECATGGAWTTGSCPQGEAGGACLCGAGASSACHPNADVCVGTTCVLGIADNGKIVYSN